MTLADQYGRQFGWRDWPTLLAALPPVAGAHLRAGAGFAISSVTTARDRELSFDGAADADVIDAWRDRLDRMPLLRAQCGGSWEAVRAAVLPCLAHPDHRSLCNVTCCVATKRT